jgi:hypothetical protein
MGQTTNKITPLASLCKKTFRKNPKLKAKAQDLKADFNYIGGIGVPAAAHWEEVVSTWREILPLMEIAERRVGGFDHH